MVRFCSMVLQYALVRCGAVVRCWGTVLGCGARVRCWIRCWGTGWGMVLAFGAAGVGAQANCCQTRHWAYKVEDGWGPRGDPTKGNKESNWGGPNTANELHAIHSVPTPYPGVLTGVLPYYVVANFAGARRGAGRPPRAICRSPGAGNGRRRNA